MTEPAPAIGLYQDPSIYDILHTPGTAAEVDGLERIASLHVHARGKAAGTWLEPACGTARHLRLAAKRGYRSIGFDRDDAMIRYARRRMSAHTDARLTVADMTSFIDDGACRPGEVGFAFNLINSIRHLMSDADLLAHLHQVADALARGGIYAVGLSTAAYGYEQPSEDVWTGARGPCRVTQIVQYEPAGSPGDHDPADRLERVISHLVIERPRGTEHADSTYELRTYSLSEWHSVIDRSAMTIAAVTDELGDPAPPAEAGYRVYLLAPNT